MPVKFIPPVKKETPLSLICDGDEHRLDIGDFTPVVSTLLLADAYFNFDNADLKTTEPGRVEVWMRRAAWNGQQADDTFFVAEWIHREGWSHKDTRMMMEWCDAGRPLRWYYKANGLNKVTLGTRFIKYAVVT